jgi:hypothetical protein
MRRAVAVVLFLVGLSLFVWGAVFKQRQISLPGFRSMEEVLPVDERTLNELMSREALAEAPTGLLRLSPGTVRRLPAERSADSKAVRDAAESTGGACAT